MKSLYSNSELVQLAENSKTIIELTEVCTALKYLYEEHNANISLQGFNLLAHFRVRQLIKQNNH